MLQQLMPTQPLSLDKIRYPIDPEQILPVQFKPDPARGGPERICLACLESVSHSLQKLRDYAQGQECLLKQFLDTPVTGALREYQLDLRWILGKDEEVADRPYSFTWVCDALELPADRLRAAYMRYLEAPGDAVPEEEARDKILLTALQAHPCITIAEIARATSQHWQKTWETIQRLEATGIVGMRKTPHGRKTYFVVGDRNE